MCFALAATTIGLNAEALIVCMLIAATAAGLLAVGRGRTFRDLQDVTGEKLAAVLPVLLILLAMGGLIGSWVFAGTIPLLVALGVEWVRSS